MKFSHYYKELLLNFKISYILTDRSQPKIAKGSIDPILPIFGTGAWLP